MTEFMDSDFPELGFVFHSVRGGDGCFAWAKAQSHHAPIWLIIFGGADVDRGYAQYDLVWVGQSAHPMDE